MASDPTVCCIMLTRDRPEMAARAVAAYNAQTYQRRRLLIYDTSAIPPAALIESRSILHFYRGPSKASIGELRNEANEFAMIGVQPAEIDIFAHADDDDWSHPNRLAEQVALLQASGADLVGYNKALFWKTFPHYGAPEGSQQEPTAYLYRNDVPPTYVLGSSMLYWRKTWEAHPFDAISHGEDERFRVKCGKVVAVSSFGHPNNRFEDGTGEEPRMICSIHGGNTSPFDPATSPQCCRRVPEWDSYCERVMKMEVRA